MAQPAAASHRLIAGAMSGTSADGVDVALVKVCGSCGQRDGQPPFSADLLHHHQRPYDALLRRALFELRQSGQTHLANLAWIGREISWSYAAAVNELLVTANVPASALAAVAAHGQTLYHAPPDTIQWLDPALIAAEVGCAVVSDFRRADCAAGGQGAPLVPFADDLLFRHPTIHRVMLNLGGIANITCLWAGHGRESVIAFDTGPGNCLSDYLMRTHRPSSSGVDVDGVLAMQGKPVRAIVDAAGRHAYFTKRWPKSTDGPEMIRIYAEARRVVPGRITLEDELATACCIAATQIARAIESCARECIATTFAGELIASGGGVHNPALMGMLRQQFENRITIRTAEELGMPSEAKESVAFALLAAATLDGVASNLPSVTGARRAVVLGAVTPKP
jgi:anhydro-N-acetylmuramic acid kinase